MSGDDAHYYEPSQGHGLRMDPLNAIVGPRPIGWISTIDAGGTCNLAPYSFFNAFNYRPPIIGFSSIGWKDTVANIESTREFVWNLATVDNAEAMNQTSAAVPSDIDEFLLSHLTPVPSKRVRPPRVLESPVNFECRLTQLVQLQSQDRELIRTWIVLGEIVAVHIDRRVIEDDEYKMARAQPILRAGGSADYVAVLPEGLFQMKRPG